MLKYLLAVILLTLAVVSFIGYTRFFAPTTGFAGKEKIIYIPSDKTHEGKVMEIIEADSVVKKPGHFRWMAAKMNYWESIKPGRYKIASGMSVREIVALLRSGNQAPSRLVMNKLRLPEHLAKAISRAIEADSVTVMAFLANKDSMTTFGLNEENWSAHLIPDTYEVIWTWSTGRVLKKLVDDREKWWQKHERLQKAEAKGLTPEKVHIIASIIEEETNKAEDKPKVASVYLNRMQRGMPLQADPTVRFAMKDFVSNRVLYSHLRTPSPYNTYINRGLPPGPICTASPSSLDAVLNAPKTDYIFFVADADLRGGSTFTTNLSDHNKAAKVYQDSLTAWLKRKALKERALKDSLAKAGQSAQR
jgi:UPF0755 protein